MSTFERPISRTLQMAAMFVPFGDIPWDKLAVNHLYPLSE